MLKRISRKTVRWLVLAALIFTAFGQNVLNAGAVTASKISYDVYIYGQNLFISNKKTIGSEIGTEYFMTYTVKSVKSKPSQQGLCGASEPEKDYPYADTGFLRHSNNALENSGEDLLTENATYYIRFTIAKECFRYNVTRVLDGKQENLYFEDYAGDATEKMGYFGLWFGILPTNAVLTGVRCYDSEGNDLGVRITENQGMVLNTSTYLKKDTKINHWYDVNVNKKNHIAISHIKKPTSSKVYLEYKVESADYLFQQEGIALSNKPKDTWPHASGGILYNSYANEGTDSILLLDVGAEYIICMERTDKGYTAFVQKTKDGKVSLHAFEAKEGMNWEQVPSIFSLWFGESTIGSFRLTNVKFYDENANDLKVQCNQNVEIIHRGALEDYAGCEATYYCEETEDSFALYADQQMKFTRDNATMDGTYQISDNVLTTDINKKTEVYNYLYAKITDKEEKVYHRLYNYKVSFVTGNGTEIETQELNNKNGYMVLRPTDPVMEGYEFQGWCLKDGTEYNFDKIVNKSVTLYAKWSGDGGITFLADEKQKAASALPMFLWIIGGVVILAASVVIGAVCIRKGVSHAGDSKK